MQLAPCMHTVKAIGFIYECMVYCLLHYFMLTALLPDKRCLSHGMCLYQVMMTLHFLNDGANDPESPQQIENYVIIASLKSETMVKLINSHLLMASFPGSASRTHVES